MSAPGGHLLRGPGSRVTGQVRGAGDERPAAPGGTRSTHSSLHLPPTPPGHPRPAAPPGMRLGSGLGASPPLVQPPRVRQGAGTAAGAVGDVPLAGQENHPWDGTGTSGERWEHRVLPRALPKAPPCSRAGEKGNPRHILGLDDPNPGPVSIQIPAL